MTHVTTETALGSRLPTALNASRVRTCASTHGAVKIPTTLVSDFGIEAATTTTPVRPRVLRSSGRASYAVYYFIHLHLQSRPSMSYSLVQVIPRNRLVGKFSHVAHDADLMSLRYEEYQNLAQSPYLAMSRLYLINLFDACLL